MASLAALGGAQPAAGGDPSFMNNVPDPTLAGKDLPTFKFALEKSDGKVIGNSYGKEATVTQLPISKGIAGVSMRLEPGAMRELHWHATAAEWAFVLRAASAPPSSIGGLPENNFDPRRWYSPPATPPSPGTSPPSPNLQQRQLPQLRPFHHHHRGRQPPPPPEKIPPPEPPPPQREYSAAPPPPPRPLSEHPRRPTNTHLGQPPHRPPAARPSISFTFPSKTRLSSPPSPPATPRYRIERLQKGDVGYIPQGYGHSIENVGSGPARILIGFNAGIYETIDLSQWIAANPQDVLATNFGQPADVFGKFPDRDVFIADKDGGR